MGGDWGGPRTQGGRWPPTVTPAQCPPAGRSVQGRASPTPLPSTPSPSTEHPHPHPPCTFRPVFWGCCRRDGELLHYIADSAREGRAPGSPSPQLSAPPHGSPSFSLNVLPRGPHLKPCPQPQNPRPESRPVPPHLGGACCACRGAGGQAGVLCPRCLRPQEEPRCRDPFQNLCLASPRNTNPPNRLTLGFQSIVRGFVVW